MNEDTKIMSKPLIKYHLDIQPDVTTSELAEIIVALFKLSFGGKIDLPIGLALDEVPPVCARHLQLDETAGAPQPTENGDENG